MSSLQKFHRRTLAVSGGGVLFGALGAGSDTAGYYLGTAGDGVSKLIVAPISTEVQKTWGSYGTSRGVTSTTNGIANTNTLYAFGSAAHPAAYYTKTLTNGGYNTWYLPARNELITCLTNRLATPFATTNAFTGSYHWSSTENGGGYAFVQMMAPGSFSNNGSKNNVNYLRAIRRTTF